MEVKNDKPLQNLRKLNPDVILIRNFLLKFPQKESLIYNSPNINFKAYKSKLARFFKYKKTNNHIYFWYVNTKHDFYRLQMHPVSGVVTDYPDLLMQLSNYND